MSSNIETYVNQLPTPGITARRLVQQISCQICLEAFEIEKFDAKVLACGHKFHTACLIDWIKRSSTCPCCRLALPQFAQTSSQDGTSRQRDGLVSRSRDQAAPTRTLRSTSRRRNQEAPIGRVRSTSRRRRNEPSQIASYVPTTDVIAQRRSLSQWREESQTSPPSSNEPSCIIS